MKKLILVLAFGLVLGMATSALAVPLIDLANYTTDGVDNVYLSGQKPYLYVMWNILYPSNTVADNNALEAWENNLAIANGLYTSNSGKVYFVARYAGYSHIIYIDGTSTVIANDSGYGTAVFDSTPSDVLTVPDTIAFGLMADSSTGPDWFSQPGKNGDGKYHFIVLNTPDPNKLLIGLEDKSQGSDWDYNDFVILTENFRPIPEPGSMALLGMGVLGLFGLKRKKIA